jgi:nicotinamidase/pyrazinamidase
MTTICWDVDTQVDFIHPDGALAVPGAEAIVPQLRALTEWAHRTHTCIVATADDHDLGHAEISDRPDWVTTFPPHCMRGTPGQLKIPATALLDPLVVHSVPHDATALSQSVREHRGEILINKPGTDVFRWNPNAATVLAALAPARIIVYGVATDICVLAAVNGFTRLAPKAELVIVRDAVRALNEAAGQTLLADWAARGALLMTAAEITE